MNPKQTRFVQEYLRDLNATQAAIRAGYSAKTAEQQGPRLLGNAGVQAAIQAGQKRRQERTEVTADMVVKELARIAFGDARAIFNAAGELMAPKDWPDGVAAAIAGVEIVTVSKGEGAVEHTAKIKTWDKVRALELLARHLGMLNDKMKLEGDLSAAVKIYLPGNGRDPAKAPA